MAAATWYAAEVPPVALAPLTGLAACVPMLISCGVYLGDQPPEVGKISWTPIGVLTADTAYGEAMPADAQRKVPFEAEF